MYHPSLKFSIGLPCDADPADDSIGSVPLDDDERWAPGNLLIEPDCDKR